MGVPGLLASIAGLVAARRPGVAGTGCDQFGLLFDRAVVVLAGARDGWRFSLAEQLHRPGRPLTRVAGGTLVLAGMLVMPF